MKTVKAYTDIPQSKRLAEILPLESADMWYSYYGNSKYNPIIAYKGEQLFLCQIRNSLHSDIPCWSLAALLDILSKTAHSIDEDGSVDLSSYKNIEWNCRLINIADLEVSTSLNPVDACYKMIININELNLL